MTEVTNEVATEPKAEKPPKDHKNGVTKPTSGRTLDVWLLTEQIWRDTGVFPGRKEVIEAFVARGGNPSTGGTQYGKARKYYGIPAEPRKVTEKATPAQAVPEQAAAS